MKHKAALQKPGNQQNIINLPMAIFFYKNKRSYQNKVHKK